MIDEQIVINGVIVNRCANYSRAEYKNGHVFENVCKLNAFGFCEDKYCKFKFNEIVKQLRNKEEECNKLKSIVNDNETYISELKAEYEVNNDR